MPLSTAWGRSLHGGATTSWWKQAVVTHNLETTSAEGSRKPAFAHPCNPGCDNVQCMHFSPHGGAQAKVKSSDEAHASPTQVPMSVCNGTQVDPTENEKLDGLALACTCPRIRKHESKGKSKQRNLMNPWDVFDHPHTMRQRRASLDAEHV